MNSDIPYQFRLPKAHRVQLFIPRKQLNFYLSRLWSKFAERIGPVACVHKYSRPPYSKDPNLYIYTIDWSHRDLPFVAQVSFYNELSKGLVGASVAAIERDSDSEDTKTTKQIIEAILEAQKDIDIPIKKTITGIAQVSLLSLWPLSGLYELDDVVLYPDQVTPVNVEMSVFRKYQRAFSSQLEFSVYSPSPAESYIEAFETARNIAAALSVLTQNLFVLDTNAILINDPITFKSQFEVRNKALSGTFTDDTGLFKEQPQKNEKGEIDIKLGKEIIEPDDVINDGKIELPLYCGKAIGVVMEDSSLVQSVRRFQEGLIFHHEIVYDTQRFSLGYAVTPYQLIAFVASIEALLDTSTHGIEHPCPSCGKTIILHDRQITKKFRAFITDYLGENPIFKKCFDDLYTDRSKFVHTGKDLYNPTAFGFHLPLVIEGKDYKKPTPYYYTNIPDFTGLLLRRYTDVLQICAGVTSDV